MPFAYQAVDARGREVASVTDAATVEEATEQLHAQGLFVTKLSEISQDASGGSGARRQLFPKGRPGNAHDRMMLTRQMSMMLRAGSQVVPAMTAVESQIDKPAWRKIVRDICQRVETGSSLSESMADYPGVFDETFRTVIAAGESTGSTADAFDRLAAMTKKQQEIKIRIIGALAYPVILLVLSFAAVGVLLFYVLPKFEDLYATLSTPLPLMTTMMLGVSAWAVENQMILVSTLALASIGSVLAWRHPASKRWFDTAVTRMPVTKTLVSKILLARIFRIWGILVRSNVPLLEALRLARSSTKNGVFLRMLDAVISAVEGGDTVGHALSKHSLVPATMSSAIATGEQSGQLADSLLFLADYLDDENAQTLATLARMVEPLILVAMGLVVGGIAISLFLPLFDLTSAASGH